jgi:hypothetical protein
MLARSLDCHAKMNHGKGRDTEWIGLVLGFLKTFVGMKDGGKRDSVLLRPAIASQFDLTSGGTPKGHAYLRELVTGVRDAAAQLDKGRSCTVAVYLSDMFSSTLQQTSSCPTTLRSLFVLVANGHGARPKRMVHSWMS